MLCSFILVKVNLWGFFEISMIEVVVCFRRNNREMMVVRRSYLIWFEVMVVIGCINIDKFDLIFFVFYCLYVIFKDIFV